MSSKDIIVKSDALPQQTIQPLEPGANNIFQSGMMAQQNKAQLQHSLVGGIRRRKKTRKFRNIKGGDKGAQPVVLAPTAPSYDTNPKATDANYTKLTELAVGTQNNAAYDATVFGTPSDVAKISAVQQAPFKGGRKMRSLNKRGGFWGCLSGGKKSRKHTKKCRCKRKTKRYRHRRH